MNQKERPSIFVGWVHKGRKSFEVVPESQYGDLLRKLLLEKRVHPGAIFISKMTLCHWVDAKYHKGEKHVSVYTFWEEINNINSPDVYYKEPKLKREPKPTGDNYGYISPDGRYFHCEYFGHSTLAREIVGKLEKIDNPQDYLYDNGWLCIYHDPYKCGKYAIAMGYKKHMTDKQLHMLDVLKIPHNSYGFQRYLLGEEYDG